MNTRVFLRLALLAIISMALSPRLPAQVLPADEKAKIEALLTHLAGLSDTTFIRNGSTYDAKTAAKFLRKKWEANEKDIKTAADFITKAATASSTTGKPYLIRPKNAAEIPCADYLNDELKKLEFPRATSPCRSSIKTSTTAPGNLKPPSASKPFSRPTTGSSLPHPNTTAASRGK